MWHEFFNRHIVRIIALRPISLQMGFESVFRHVFGRASAPTAKPPQKPSEAVFRDAA